MLTGSLSDLFDIMNSSIDNGTGSVGNLAGDGIGSLGDVLGPLFDGLETMSGAGE